MVKHTILNVDYNIEIISESKHTHIHKTIIDGWHFQKGRLND